MNRALALIACAALLVSHGAVARLAWTTAADRAEARHTAAVAALESDLALAAQAARRLQAQLLTAEAERAALVERLEDEARRDPRAVERVPGADSLRRLEVRWGAP